MTPPTWHNLLQQHLDGGLGRDEMASRLPPGADRQAVERFLTGLTHLMPPAPPPALAGRVVASLQVAARTRRRQARRQWTSTAGLVVAASLLLALGLRVGWPTREKPIPLDPVRVTQQPRNDSSAEPLRDSVGRAGSALASLTTQRAGATVEQTSSLLPLVFGPALPPFEPTSGTMEPPLEALREASTGVSAGLAPVTDSAQRAVQLFLRDLPMGRAPTP